MDIIYGGKIVETGRSDLKRVQKRNKAHFWALKSGIFSSGGGSKSGIFSSGEGQNLAFFLWGRGGVKIWHFFFGVRSKSSIDSNQQ